MRAIIFLLLFSPGAYSQEPAKPPGKISGPRVRFCAFSPPPGNLAFGLAAENVAAVPVEMPANGFGQPIAAPSRQCLLGTLGAPAADGKRPFKPLLPVVLPEPGNAFLVLLLPKEASFEAKVIRADDPAIKEGDLHVFNLTDTLLSLVLKGKPAVFQPGSMQRLTPPATAENETYQVEFHARIDGDSKLFGATTWGAAPGRSPFIFMFKDPATGRCTYRAVEVFTSWLKEEK